MKIGFLQLDVAFEQKDRNIRQAQELLLPIECDIMVFPELFATGAIFYNRAHAASLSEPIPGGQTSQAVINMAKEKQSWIVAGILESDGDMMYNSAIVAGPQGYIGKHRKVNLSIEEKGRCVPGTSYETFLVAGIKIGILICLDNEKVEAGKILVKQGAKLICQPANHQGIDMPKLFRAMAKENSVHTISCNRVGFDHDTIYDTPFIGVSQIVGPDGNIIHQAPERLETVHVMTVDIKG